MNQSELRAFRAVDAHLRGADGDAAAFILTNLTHGNPHGQADEIDMVVIGSGGAIVIEVKHWDGAAIRRVADMEDHAALITAKTKRVAGRLKAVDPALGSSPLPDRHDQAHGPPDHPLQGLLSQTLSEIPVSDGARQ